jgi:hypothetical protein
MRTLGFVPPTAVRSGTSQTAQYHFPLVLVLPVCPVVLVFTVVVLVVVLDLVDDDGVDTLELVPAPVSVPVPLVPVLSRLQAANNEAHAISTKVLFIVSFLLGCGSLLYQRQTAIVRARINRGPA